MSPTDFMKTLETLVKDAEIEDVATNGAYPLVNPQSAAGTGAGAQRTQKAQQLNRNPYQQLLAPEAPRTAPQTQAPLSPASPTGPKPGGAGGFFDSKRPDFAEQTYGGGRDSSKMSTLSQNLLAGGYDVRQKSPFASAALQQQQQQQTSLAPSNTLQPQASPRRGRSPNRSANANMAVDGTSQVQQQQQQQYLHPQQQQQQTQRLSPAGLSPQQQQQQGRLSPGGGLLSRSPARSPSRTVVEPSLPLDVPADRHMPKQLTPDPLTGKARDEAFAGDLDATTLESLQERTERGREGVDLDLHSVL